METLVVDMQELDIAQTKEINGGSWVSYALGYILSTIYYTPSVDETRYGGVYLETVSGRSSIM